MPIFLSLLILYPGILFAKCEFKNNVVKVFSLSGPVTVLLDELKLLNHPKTLGISIFHPYNANDFKGKFYPGGIFLSHSVVSDFQNGLVFFDESKELKRLFKSQKNITGIEVKSRNLLPLEAFEASVKALKPHLSGCEVEIQKVYDEAQLLQEQTLKAIVKKQDIVFYLGELRGGKRPEIVMVNDGVVKLLVKEKKISTYPSELAYVNWSSRIIRSLPGNTLHIGLIDSGKNKTIKIKRSSQEMTFYYPGSLIPGLSQLRAFQYLFKNI